MANKKISELQSRTPVLADLMLVGDPSSGYAYKCTITALSTVIETAIGGNYVTLATTQTISGAKTFSNNVTLTSVQNAPTDPDKFLTLNASNIVTYRTGAEVLSDIGGQGSLTLTTTGTSGAATLVGNTLNIPNYAPDLSGYVPNTRTLTINGTTFDLSANRTWSVGTVTSVAATAGTGISISGSPITSSGTLTITNTAPDQTVVLTAGTGISVSGTYPNFTITNSSPSSGGTVTSVAALTLGTTGTDLSSTVANGTTTPVITLNVPTASATNRGALSSTDWSTFNNKQSAITLTTTGTSGAATLVGATLNIPQYQSALTNPVTGTGTTNYVSKFTGASTIGNSQIFDNGTNVGVGVSNPGSYNGNADNLVIGGTADAGITIVGDPSEGTSNLYLADGTTGDQAYRGFLSYAHSNDALAIGTSGTTKMTLNSSGNLGLGVTPNAWGAGQVAFEYGTLGTLVSTGSAVSLQNNSYNNGTNNIRKVIGEASSYTQSGGAHIWQTAASGTTGSTISFSEVMRITSTGNVGIGTSSPAEKLDLQGTMNMNGASGTYLQVQYNGANRGYLGTANATIASGATTDLGISATSNLVFGTGGSLTERMRITSGGNLGLGVTPSAWGFITPIQIKNSTFGGYTTGTTHITYTASNWYLNGSGTDTYIANGAATLYSQASGQHAWYNAPSGTAGNAITFTQAMTLNSSGNLGLGVTPSAWTAFKAIEIGGIGNGIAGAANQSVIFSNAYYSTNWKYASTGQATNYDQVSGQHRWFNAPSGVAGNSISFTQAMTLDASGRLGIGTTSPATTLHIVGTMKFSNTEVAGGYMTLEIVPATAIGSTVNKIVTINTTGLAFETGLSERMRITSGGEVYIAGTTDQGAYNLQVNGTGVWGAGAYVNGSDSALKQNIQPLDNSLDIVKQMKPVTYTYKDFYSKDTSVQTGFIAQDLQVLLKDKNYLNGIVKDGTYLSVAYQNLIPLLVKAIQEQQIEIDNLKNK